MKSKIKTALTILEYIAIAIMSIITIYALYNKMQPDGKNTTLFGYTPTIVMSGSMLPNIEVYSLCMMKSYDINEIEVGDIIVYRNSYAKKNVIHRVIDIEYNNEEPVLTTKGDNNNAEDELRTTSDNFLGKIVYIGNWASGIIKFSILPDGTGFDYAKLAAISAAFIMVVWLILIILSELIKYAIVNIKSNKNKEDKQNGKNLQS